MVFLGRYSILSSPGPRRRACSTRHPGPRPPAVPALAATLARAAAALARLDQALAAHPLRPAFLHRARLEAVRRQGDVDGLAIDPWHLAALLEGLRLRVEGTPCQGQRMKFC